MAITNQQQIHILGIVAGLFNAAPGGQYLTEFANAIEAGLTEPQLADILAAHPVFTDGIIGNQNSTSSQVAVLMRHYGLEADGVNGSAASQAEAFFTHRIDSGVGFGEIIVEAGVFLLGNSVPEEFIETANLYKNKIMVADVYSASNSPTELETLQQPLIDLSGTTLMTEADATTYLQDRGFIFNPNSATIDEAINGPLVNIKEYNGVSDNFVLNIISADNSEGKGGVFDVGNNIIVNLQDPAGTTAGGDAETFTLNATINDDNKDGVADGINARTIKVDGVENLVISSMVASTDGSNPDTKAAGHLLLVNLATPDAESITITGNGVVDLTPVTAIGKVKTIDASGSTGTVGVHLATHTQSVNYIGSNGVDFYFGSAAGGITFAGDSGDFINLEGGKDSRDILVLKTKSNSSISDTNGDGKITILEDVGFDEVANFKVGAASTDDRLDVSSFGFTGDQRGIVDATAKVPTFDTEISSVPEMFRDSTGVDRGLAFSEIPLPPDHEFAPNQMQTFVFIDVNKDGDFTAADDMLIELMDIGPMSDAIFIFQ